MSALVFEGLLGKAGRSVAIKDSIDVAGWPTRAGSRAFADAAPAERHAGVVQALLDDGWQLIGKAGMHELAFGVTGINDWAGTPLNPQAPDRIPGGSSSGSAAIVAQGAADIAIGTDTGGSVRMPAACCGVYGFKPTFGRLSREGVQPANSTLDCVGPMAREIHGIVAAMAAMDHSFIPQPPARGYRIGVVAVDCATPVAEAMAEALQRSSWQCSTVHLPLLGAAFDAGLTVINVETWAAFGELTGQGLLGADVEARLLKASATTAQALAEAESVRQAFSAQVDQLLEHFDALALPSLPRLPPLLEEVRNGAPVIDLTCFLRPFNLSGHPALSIPVACPGSPLKAGLQLVGRKGGDAQLCAIGASLGLA
jgi:amidase